MLFDYFLFFTKKWETMLKWSENLFDELKVRVEIIFPTNFEHTFFM
jgi:hypothetical protein